MSIKKIAWGYMCVLLLVMALSLLSGCSTIEPSFQNSNYVESYADYSGSPTFLENLLSSSIEQHPEKSGVLLLDKGEESLLWRGMLVDKAEKSIDIQTFIWEDDNVGTIAAERVLRAADRGVRVRVLIDHFMLATDKQYLGWLDAHPHIEIRIYNPITRIGSSALFKALSIFKNWTRNNRRMHNKLFVVDNSVAVAGGRNIADSYFDMNDKFNYRDRDVLIVGQVLSQLTDSFDVYWNSGWAVPISSLYTDETSDSERHAYYSKLRSYAKNSENYPPRFSIKLDQLNESLSTLNKRLIWAPVTAFADIPGKNKQINAMTGFGVSGRVLSKYALETKHEILAETPYLVTMPGTLELLRELENREVDVRILTNSLNSTDNHPAFGAYVRQRRRIADSGVALYELRDDPAFIERIIERTEHIKGDTRLGLHAKSAVFDRQYTFIGSFNLDPRSTHLNTELGVIVDSEDFAKQVADSILEDMDLKNSWRVYRNLNDQFIWETERDGQFIRSDWEPEVTIPTFFKMLPFILFPYESIL